MADAPPITIDALIVGAGFAGMYMLHKLRSAGIGAVVVEAGSGVGGTWFWNRYPGARVDIQSLEYSFGFDDSLARDWRWSERYAPQPELLRYADHVAERFDLKRDIVFDTRVTAAHWDAAADRWHVTTDTGATYAARYVILATGCLSIPTDVTFPGIDDFAGPVYRTSRWPQGGVDFAGQRVGIIGTGSSAIQSIPIIAETAAHLTVFQRTPNYSMPAHNGAIPADDFAAWAADPAGYRAASRDTAGGYQNETRDAVLATETDPDTLRAELERRWAWGGFRILGAFGDTAIDPAANAILHDFVAGKIREQVTDPAVAALLTPNNHPFGTKRPCVDSGYYATFNRPNVELVDLHAAPIVTFTPTGIATTARAHNFDAIVLATGFDAMTGAIDRIDIRGPGGTVRDHWAAGPRTYLGLMIAGFPNLFTITGPGSPSVLTNMVNAIEQHVEWIADCLVHLGAHQQTRIEASPEAEAAWSEHVRAAVTPTLMPHANSWYMGANVPGKPRMFMPYAGGLNTYAAICNTVVAKGYEGFVIGNGDAVQPGNRTFTSHPPMPDIPEKLLPIIVERLTAAGLMPA